MWHIPITYVVVNNLVGQSRSSSSSGGTTPLDRSYFTKNLNFFWLRPSILEVVHYHKGAFQLDVDSPVILNINHIGLYHVRYDEKNWKLIARTLKKSHTLIPLATRMQLADAIWAGWKYGYINSPLALCVGEYIKVRI